MEKITTYYRGKDTLSKLCKELHEKALSLINTEKKSLTPLTNEEQKKHDESSKCHICKKSFVINKSHKFYNKLIKVIDHGHYTVKYRGAAHSICNLTYETQRDIPVAIYNGSNCDFHLLIVKLAKEFRSDMKCIPEDKEKYILFSIPLKKESEDGKFTTYNLRFIDSARFMEGSLDSHVNNLSELYECKCEDKDRPIIRVICKKDAARTYCRTCRKRSKQSKQSLKDKFASTYQLSNNDNNKFILLLRKGVYPYEYMNTLDIFKETKLQSKVCFNCKSNSKLITVEDYEHAHKVWNILTYMNIMTYMCKLTLHY